MDYGPRESLLEEGVSEGALDALGDAVATTTRELATELEVTLTDPEAAVSAVRTEVFEMALRLGDGSEDSTVREQFRRLAEDFEDPSSERAQSSVVFILGALETQADTPADIRRVSRAYLSKTRS